MVDVAFAESLSEQFGGDRLVFAVDSRGGRVAIHGWKTITRIDPAAMMQQLEPFCSAFLYTHIDTEGLLKGIPMDVIRDLRQRTSHRLIAAGGIHRAEEIEELDKIGRRCGGRNGNLLGLAGNLSGTNPRGSSKSDC